MTRHYTTKECFRQMPNKLLARFFQDRGLFQALDFTAMKETKPDELFNAWLLLPEEDCNEIDTVLQEIFELSCEKGYIAIIDEARWQMQGNPEELAKFIETLSALPNHYHRAMVTYLKYNECWKGATRFYHIDTLTYYWRKRKHMGHNCAATDIASIDQLADLIRQYFHYSEGRGKNCIVEVLRRGSLDCFLAHPEDYSQQSIEWVNGKFAPRPHNPAFQVVFIYSQKDGTLDLYFQGSSKAVESLQGVFATAILKLDQLPPDPKDTRI